MNTLAYKIVLTITALSLAALTPMHAAPASRVLVLTGTSIQASDVNGGTPTWTWAYPAGTVSPRAVVFPNGSGSFDVLVMLRIAVTPATYCLSGVDGTLKWQIAGDMESGEDGVLTHNLYTDPDLYPAGPPNLGGQAPILLINQRQAFFGGSTSRILCVDSASGQTLWTYTTAPGDHWAVSFIPDVNGDGYYDVIVRSSGSSGLWCLSGMDGQTVLWFRPDLERGGVPIRDVTGDGKYDYIVGQCCWDDSVYCLNGATGATVWQNRFGSFDLTGIHVWPGTSDVIISAQLGGGVRRYNGATGQVMWSCDSAYNDTTTPGLIPVPSGYKILCGWRHQNLAFCLTATGQTVWDNIPAVNSDYIGIVVPDQDGDGQDDLLVENLGQVTIYSARTGAGLATLPWSDVHYMAYMPAANHPPEVAMDILPLVHIPGAANPIAVAADGQTAHLTLDGSRSSDPDGDTLQFLWKDGANALSTEAIADVQLGLGTHQVTLEVTDGAATSTATSTIDVLPPAAAVTELMLAVINSEPPQNRKNPLLVTLAAARSSFERGNYTSGLNQLAAFQNKVRAQIVPINPDLAAALVSAATDLAQGLQSKSQKIQSL